MSDADGTKSQDTNSGEANSEGAAPAERLPATTRKFFPPTWLLSFAVLIVFGLAFMFNRSAFLEDNFPGLDKAVQNIICVLSIFLLVVLTMIWFLIRYPIPVIYRLAISGALVTLAVGFIFLVEPKQNTGSIWPAGFKWRWAPHHDERLAKVSFDSTMTVDLSYALEAGEPDTNFSQYLGANRDGAVPGVELATDWNRNPPKTIWKQEIGAGWAGFAAANGFAVTLEQRGEEELTTCYHILSGEIVWAHPEQVRHATVPGGIGPRSTPTIDPTTGNVYSTGGTGILVCLDGKDGSLLWRKDIRSEVGTNREKEILAVAWGRSASPLIVDDKVIVAGGGTDGAFDSLIGYDKTSGGELWRGGNDQISYSSPMLMKLEVDDDLSRNIIVIVNEASVSGHDPETGEKLWSHKREGTSNGAANVAQPVKYPGNRLLLTKGYGLGAELIELQASDESDGNLKAVQIWNNKRFLRTKMTNAVRLGNYAFGLNDEVLECIDVVNNKRMWRGGRYGSGQVLRAGNHLIVLSEDGSLVLVPAKTDELKEVARIDEVLTSITWNTICLHQFEEKWYLLIRNGEQAACLEMKVAQAD